jgi:raffinose/stachyose/melibiose transport system permease protein
VAVGVYWATGEHSSDLGALFGFMFLASVPVLVFFLAFQRHFVRGLTGGAAKVNGPTPPRINTKAQP